MSDSASPTPFDELKARFAEDKTTDLEVLRHCLGLEDICMQASSNKGVTKTGTIAQELAKQTLLVCIDVEHYTLNSAEMTEIGIGIMETNEALNVSLSDTLGDHGESLMQLGQYHHFRLVEKSHLPTTNKQSRGPEGNRFGGTRFVTFNDARKVLRKILVQPITQVIALQGFNRPVVIMGHSGKHDREHLNGKDLAFDTETLGTVVRNIDTQQIAEDCKYWLHPTDPIGLVPLVSKLGFEHTDPHTAANDAARTLMCAILMAIPKKARQGCRRSTQDVARDLETYTQVMFEPLGGTEEYCSKCGSTSHMAKACTEDGLLRCDECVSRGLNELSTKHITLHCPIVAEEVVLERKAWYDDQQWTPKYPYSSRDRLQTFAPNTPTVPSAKIEEVAARRRFYDKQCNSGQPLKAFTWDGRAFKNSPQCKAGMPQGSRPILSTGSTSSRGASSSGSSALRGRGGRGSGRGSFRENTGNWDSQAS